MSKLAVKRPVTTLMAILVVIGLGIMSVFNLQLDSMPNMNMPIAMVMTTYTGAGPEEVLELVTKQVESSLATLDGLKTMTSQSSAGRSQVMLEFENDVDIDQATKNMSEALANISNRLPDDASTPVIRRMSMDSSSIMTISVASDSMSLVDLKSTVEDKLVDRLERQQGVASVDVTGGRQKEIVVEFIEEKAVGYGITMTTISQLLSNENRDSAGGNVREGTKSINVRTKGQLKSIDDIKNLVLSTAGGGVILLQDVANVSEQYKEVTSYSYVNGKPNITIQVSKQSTANTVSVSDALTKEIEAIRAQYPQLSINITSDSADDVRVSINAVIEAAWQGMLLAIIVLYVFLRNIKSTIVVALAMPISMVSIFMLMYYAGLTLNTMSLSGLVLGVGMLVDNSIVVLESVFRRMEEGESRIDAAINGAKEVAMSVTASTLTTVAVFLPITFMGGLVAQYFNDLAFTISFSLLCSLIVSLTFVPMTCSLILTPETKSISRVTGAISNAVGKVLDVISAGYRVLLGISLRFKYIVVVLSVACFVYTLNSMGSLGTEFMTFGTAAEVNLSISLPEGTVLEETVKAAEEANRRLEKFSDVIKTSSLRVSGTNVSYQISLIDRTLREKDNDTITRELRQEMSTMAGVQVSTSARRFGGGMGGGVSIEIKGNDMEVLEQIGEDFVEILSGIEGIVEPSSSISSATQEAVVTINRAKAAKYGISASSVASLIYSSINGSTPTTIKADGTELDVTLKYKDDKLPYLTDVSNLLIRTSTGAYIPISEISDMNKANTTRTIRRTDQQTYATVSASLDRLDSGTASAIIQQTLDSEYVMPMGYNWGFGSNQRRMDQAFEGLWQALILSLFLVYAIMASEFESLYYPFIIMFSIPIALSSGLFGLRLFGSTLSVTAYLGLIMLAGIVVNNAIVLIDYINILRRERGMELATAIKTAGPVRLRAILMATATTVLGLVPMMIGASEGSETMQPLAIVIVFGLSVSTLVTLLLIPCLYSIFEGIAQTVGRLFNRTPAAKDAGVIKG